jgi:two-component system cell cycle sensor histidine kinase/response regulator CckA
MLWLYLTGLLPVALLLVVFLYDAVISARPKTSFTPEGKAVLLVDDDTKVCEITGRNLQQHGFAVLVAGDGESALRLAKTYPGRIDLLISDVLMPGMSGPLLAEQLQTIRPLTPVLFISGIAEAETLPHRKEPAVEFLAKPFTSDMLARKVGQVLGALPAAA